MLPKSRWSAGSRQRLLSEIGEISESCDSISPREDSYGFFQRSLGRLMEVYDQARRRYLKARILLGQVPVKEAMVHAARRERVPLRHLLVSALVCS